MARSQFGGSVADAVTNTAGDAQASVSVTFHDAPTAGSQYTDLIEIDGVTPISGGIVTTDAQGFMRRFLGPDTITSMWAQAGAGTRRLINPTKVSDVITAEVAASNSGKVDKGTLVKRAKDNGVGTSGDQTTAINDFLAGLAQGEVALFDAGTYTVSGVLTCPVSDVTIHLRQGAVINLTTALQDGLVCTGANVTVKGRGKIVSPAQWDGENVAWTYAVLHMKGASPRVRDITLDGVPKVGIGIRDAAGTARVRDVTVLGNYPGYVSALSAAVDAVTTTIPVTSTTGMPAVPFQIKVDSEKMTVTAIAALNLTVTRAVAGTTAATHASGAAVQFSGSWNEVETVHFGITHDPAAGADSKLSVRGAVVDKCVQGVCLGNFGAATSSLGGLIDGCDFTGCHNHGVYDSGSSEGITVSKNTFVDCSRPIAMTGAGHTVAFNQLLTTLSSGNLAQSCGIHMRNAIDCTVHGNRLKGNVFPSQPAIDFSPVSGGVVIRGNVCSENLIEVTGTNTAIGIRMGTTAITDMRDNIVQGNVVKAPGVSFQGVIQVSASGSTGRGCKVLDNLITVTGGAMGIGLAGQVAPDVRGNRVRLEYDAVSATTLGAVFIEGTSSQCWVADNVFEVPPTFGANITFRAIYENSGTTSNKIGPNRYRLDVTKLAAAVTHFMQGTSGSTLTEVGMTGAPGVACGPGSTWTRADGGASTSLYVKETAAASAVWRAV